MASIMFDALDYVKVLMDAGVSRPEAEAHARLQGQSLEHLINSELATKDDIKQLSLATKQDIKQLALATKQDINRLERDMNRMKTDIAKDLTIRLGAITATGIAVLATLMSVFHFTQ